MQKFYKKCAVIYDLQGEPMFVCDVLDFTSEEEYKALKNKAQVNFENKVNLKQKEDKEFKDGINKAIYDLAVAVKNYTNK
jgi:hypothetical protein